MKKKIHVELTIETLQNDYGACEMVEKVLNDSFLNNSEFQLEIQETKVIECSPTKSSVSS